VAAEHEHDGGRLAEVAATSISLEQDETVLAAVGVTGSPH
jgi:hypothetical protein